MPFDSCDSRLSDPLALKVTGGIAVTMYFSVNVIYGKISLACRFYRDNPGTAPPIGAVPG